MNKRTPPNIGDIVNWKDMHGPVTNVLSEQFSFTDQHGYQQMVLFTDLWKIVDYVPVVQKPSKKATTLKPKTATSKSRPAAKAKKGARR